MAQESSPIRTAAAGAVSAQREEVAAQVRVRLGEFFDGALDPATLTVTVDEEQRLALVSDGDVMLAVDRERVIRLADVVDGQPTAISEPLSSLVDLARELEGR